LALLLLLGFAIQQSGWAEGQWDAVERQFALCGNGSGAAACVIDGDTLAIGARRIRLTGYDAPELDGACEAERRLAQVARGELAAWLNLGAFEMEGGADPPRDIYGREWRAARRGGEELADTMVERDLARRSSLDRGWCEGG
jgi:endonuclease YncB( thermonuclease family)